MSDLTTKAKVKAQLGISDTTYDDYLDELITNISALVETYCNRNFTRASYTEYFDTNKGDRKLFLRNLPVSSLSSVSYKTGNFGNPTYVAFNSNEYLLKDNQTLVFSGSLPDSEQFVKVVYTGGYLIDFDTEGSATHTLPNDLELAVTELVALNFQQRQSEGVLSETTEGQSVTFSNIKFTDKLKNKLSAYRNINI